MPAGECPLLPLQVCKPLCLCSVYMHVYCLGVYCLCVCIVVCCVCSVVW